MLQVSGVHAKQQICCTVSKRLRSPTVLLHGWSCLATWSLITVKQHLLSIVTLSYLLSDIDSIHISCCATPFSSVQIPPLSLTTHHLLHYSTPISHQTASMPHCHCHCHWITTTLQCCTLHHIHFDMLQLYIYILFQKYLNHLHHITSISSTAAPPPICCMPIITISVGLQNNDNWECWSTCSWVRSPASLKRNSKLLCFILRQYRKLVFTSNFPVSSSVLERLLWRITNLKINVIRAVSHWASYYSKMSGIYMGRYKICIIQTR